VTTRNLCAACITTTTAPSRGFRARVFGRHNACAGSELCLPTPPRARLPVTLTTYRIPTPDISRWRDNDANTSRNSGADGGIIAGTTRASAHSLSFRRAGACGLLEISSLIFYAAVLNKRARAPANSIIYTPTTTSHTRNVSYHGINCTGPHRRSFPHPTTTAPWRAFRSVHSPLPSGRRDRALKYLLPWFGFMISRIAPDAVRLLRRAISASRQVQHHRPRLYWLANIVPTNEALTRGFPCSFIRQMSAHNRVLKARDAAV